MLGIVEALLGARDSSRRYHIDKAVRVVVDKTDAFLARLRRDEHDDAQVVLVSYRLHDVQIVIKGQIRDDADCQEKPLCLARKC